MKRQERREFLRNAASFALLPMVRTEAELVLWNGNIVTVDDAQPRARAVAIAAGRFLAVGSDADVLNLASARTKKVDLGGRTVVPGFIDGHAHVASSGNLHLKQVDCDLRSIEAIVAALRERAAKTQPGDWVLGFKYDDTKTAEGRPLSLADLDGVSRDHPVFVEHRGGHTAYVNSRALALAGISEATADPPGGRFDRDPATGKLTGRIAESAREPLDRLIPATLTRDDRREGVRLISKMMTRAGITSVHDAFGSPEDLQAYQDAREAGDLGLRVYCSIGWQFVGKLIEAGVRTGLGDERVRVGFMKGVCDGSISERTARLREPYVGRPNDRGILVTTEDQLYERRARCTPPTGRSALTPTATWRSTSCCASTSGCSANARGATPASASSTAP